MSILTITNFIEKEPGVLITTLIQILGDIGCTILAAIMLFSKKTDKNTKLFYGLILASFVAMTIDDIYYNYMYRIMHYNIRNSTGIIVTLTFICFQLSQIYIWLFFIIKQKIKVFSQKNIPYLLCTCFVIYVLAYFFYSNENYPISTIIVQSIEVTIDMSIWLFAIICFANTTSRPITLLALGSLLIISADLTTRCLYIFEPERLAYTMWVHMVWATGVVIILSGLFYCNKGDKFSFASENSLQVTSSSLIVLTSFISFTIGVIFLTLFKLSSDINMHSILWSLPIILMFTLIISISLAKKFSAMLADPINQILKRVNLFDSGKIPMKTETFKAKIDEFNELGIFTNSTIEKLSTQLDQELKIAAQVAHDIRSPLSALQILTEQQLIELEEPKRILLRDAVYQIRDIVNNLDQNSLSKSTETQIAILLEQVVSARRTALARKSICINENFEANSYTLFTKIDHSDIKRALTNLINNSAEAIQSNHGMIDITLKSNLENIVIIISDNGRGISADHLGLLFTRGFTTKKMGTGLGLFHAREIISQSGGSIDIESKKGEGTTITIKLPSQKPPSWFATRLTIPNNSIVTCVDDSVSIWNAWQERLRSIKGSIESRYCCDKSGLLHELGEEIDKTKTYLIDYEFSGQPYTGLDLIRNVLDYKKDLDQVLLVTSRSDLEIQEFCAENKVKIISKLFALKIPIEIISDF